MPSIRPSADLRNNYNEISKFCHEHSEPVFITRNGKGDLAVLSIEMYDKLCGKSELYKLLEDSLRDVSEGRTNSFEDVMKELRKAVSDV